MHETLVEQSYNYGCELYKFRSFDQAHEVVGETDRRVQPLAVNVTGYSLANEIYLLIWQSD